MPKLTKFTPHVPNTLLLVDDEEGIRRVLSITLSDMGYAVSAAESGEEALKIFKKEHHALVLTDIKMPGMGGIELLKAIKQERPETEVIMLTGHGDLDLAITSVKNDAIDFITKPINNDVLEIALQRAREKIATQQELKEYTEHLEDLVEEQSALLVEAEKRAAVCEVVRGFSTAMQDLAQTFDTSITYFNDMPCFVSIHSPELDIVSTNDLFRERMGDMTGKDSWAAYADADAYGTKCPAARTFSAGRGMRIRETLRDKQGNVLPVIVHTAPIRVSPDSEDVDLVLEIAADISETLRLQEELRNTRHRYQQLFDESPCYISVQNPDFTIEATNRLYTETFGDVTGKHCYEVYKQRTYPCTDCPVVRTFSDGEPHTIETVITDSSGLQRYVLIQTAALRDIHGDIVQVMEMSTDITEIRRLQDHLSSLGMLIGSVSHGIKGLLTALDGGVYKVNSGFKRGNEDQIKEGWTLVTHMVDRIKSMVLDILYYAKDRDVNWQDTNVIAFAEDVAATVAAKAEKFGITFTTQFDQETGHVSIDPAVVHPALVNILENAFEACTDDPSTTKHSVYFAVTSDKQHVYFTVKDNGIGMDAETQQNMFTLFFSSKGTKGTGLGLFISNRIIEQHGGEITVTSAQGEGTTFLIRLPKKRTALST